MIDWDDIHDVLLDMDGTLLDLHFDNHFWQEVLPRHYARGRGLDVVTAKTVLDPIFRRREGSLNWYCLDYWTRELNIDIATLKQEAAHTLLIDDNLAVLRAARHYGIKHLLAVHQPDTRRPPRDTDEFTALRDFRDILPQG